MLFKGAKFDNDQRKEENVIRNWNFQSFLFLTTLIIKWPLQILYRTQALYFRIAQIGFKVIAQYIKQLS